MDHSAISPFTFLLISEQVLLQQQINSLLELKSSNYKSEDKNQGKSRLHNPGFSFWKSPIMGDKTGFFFTFKISNKQVSTCFCNTGMTIRATAIHSKNLSRLPREN